MTAARDSRGAALQTVCATLGLVVDEPRQQALLDYLDMLQQWNATYNLTAIRDPAAMFTQHLADCLAVIPALTRQLQAVAEPGRVLRVLDVGSGGGLPGVVIAALLPVAVTCVDTVGKKAAFVREVAGHLKLANLQAVHSRVEAMPSVPFDLVTSRAFASLADFCQLTQDRLAENG
ncbi:MAG: 16S rRNA (guanine(527)-N(7))-methyltransferase RsmG, partial [Rubrivivax sp.]|nr:16S rRNA (guanine(527)-N(7))-methyltransferase RsmG [Rubrivivax sp.]